MNQEENLERETRGVRPQPPTRHATEESFAQFLAEVRAQFGPDFGQNEAFVLFSLEKALAMRVDLRESLQGKMPEEALPIFAQAFKETLQARTESFSKLYRHMVNDDDFAEEFAQRLFVRFESREMRGRRMHGQKGVDRGEEMMSEPPWWITYGPFSPWRLCPTRPDPGEVLLFYLEKHGIGPDEHLNYLMNLLDLQKSMVYNILKGEGLDSISRCRVLVKALSIPPPLLGLDGKYFPIERYSYWWRAFDLPFHAEPFGYPVMSEVVAYLRLKMTKRDNMGRAKVWSQEDLGDATCHLNQSLSAMRKQSWSAVTLEWMRIPEVEGERMEAKLVRKCSREGKVCP